MPAAQPLQRPALHLHLAAPCPLQVIALNLPEDEIEGLKAMFQSIDTDKRCAAEAAACCQLLAPRQTRACAQRSPPSCALRPSCASDHLLPGICRPLCLATLAWLHTARAKQRSPRWAPSTAAAPSRRTSCGTRCARRARSSPRRSCSASWPWRMSTGTAPSTTRSLWPPPCTWVRRRLHRWIGLVGAAAAVNAAHVPGAAERC